MTDPLWLMPQLKLNAATAPSGIAVGLGIRTYLCMGTVKNDESRITWDAVAMAQRELF